MRKIQDEKNIVKLMISLYCKKHHKSSCLCGSCEELLCYAYERVQNCPFKENKTFCSNCKVHCYKLEKREEIRAVMRFAGPRMIFYHPIIAIKHIVSTRKERSKNSEH